MLCQGVIKSVVRRYIFERLLTSVVRSEGQYVELHCVPKKRPPFYFSNNSVKN